MLIDLTLFGCLSWELAFSLGESVSPPEYLIRTFFIDLNSPGEGFFHPSFCLLVLALDHAMHVFEFLFNAYCHGTVLLLQMFPVLAHLNIDTFNTTKFILKNLQ